MKNIILLGSKVCDKLFILFLESSSVYGYVSFNIFFNLANSMFQWLMLLSQVLAH